MKVVKGVEKKPLNELEINFLFVSLSHFGLIAAHPPCQPFPHTYIDYFQRRSIDFSLETHSYGSQLPFAHPRVTSSSAIARCSCCVVINTRKNLKLSELNVADLCPDLSRNKQRKNNIMKSLKNPVRKSALLQNQIKDEKLYCILTMMSAYNSFNHIYYHGSYV